MWTHSPNTLLLEKKATLFLPRLSTHSPLPSLSPSNNTIKLNALCCCSQALIGEGYPEDRAFSDDSPMKVVGLLRNAGVPFTTQFNTRKYAKPKSYKVIEERIERNVPLLFTHSLTQSPLCFYKRTPEYLISTSRCFLFGQLLLCTRTLARLLQDFLSVTLVV